MPKLIPVGENYPKLGRRRPGGVISLRTSVAGLGQVLISTGEVDPRRAHKVAQRLERELIKNEDAPPETTFGNFAREVYESKLSTWREGTRKSAHNHIFNILIPEFDELHPKDITDQVWGRFVNKLLKRDPNRDLENTRKYMRMVMRQARNSNLTSNVLELPIPRRKRKPGIWVPRAGVEALVAAARPTLQLKILMAYLMLMRKGEIELLQWDIHVDFERELIRLREEDTKIKKARKVPIHAAVLPILRQRKAESKSRFVFPVLIEGRDDHQRSHEKHWEEAQAKAGVFCRFHDLRHSGISELVITLRQPTTHIAVIAGNSAAEIDETYLHADVDDVREPVQLMQLSLPVGLRGKE